MAFKPFCRVCSAWHNTADPCDPERVAASNPEIPAHDEARIRDRVRKLKALAADPSAAPGERDNARRMANATVSKYKLDETKKELAFLDEYRAMVTDCEGRESKLNDWERGFVSSVGSKLADDEIISGRQIETLERIWEKATRNG